MKTTKKKEHRLLQRVLFHRLWFFTYKPFPFLCASLETFFLIVSRTLPSFASPEMADDLANLCRFLFDETGLSSLSSSASSDLFSQRIRSDDSIKRGLRYFYLLLRWGIAPINDSSGKLRFQTWSDSQVQALVSISQAILLLSRSLLGTVLTLNS